MSAPARFPNGVTNVGWTSMWSRFGLPAFTDFHIHMNDWDQYTAADWVITETGTGTRAVQQAVNGIFLITNGASDDDANFLQWSSSTLATTADAWKFIAGKKLWFEARFKVSDATQSDFIMGLQITDTTPLAVSDGVYFRKDDGDANLDFVVTKDSTATTQTAFSTAADDTYMRLGFYYNGVDAIEVFKDGVKLATSVTTNLVDDEELTISFGVQNGEAVAKTMSVDFICVVAER
jgi:hypothetical protein